MQSRHRLRSKSVYDGRPPAAIDTERLHLRCWRPDDAGALLPVLEANVAHLHWIPAHVAAPSSFSALRTSGRSIAR